MVEYETKMGTFIHVNWSALCLQNCCIRISLNQNKPKLLTLEIIDYTSAVVQISLLQSVPKRPMKKHMILYIYIYIY